MLYRAHKDMRPLVATVKEVGAERIDLTVVVNGTPIDVFGVLPDAPGERFTPGTWRHISAN